MVFQNYSLVPRLSLYAVAAIVISLFLIVIGIEFLSVTVRKYLF